MITICHLDNSRSERIVWQGDGGGTEILSSADAGAGVLWHNAGLSRSRYE